jgi:microcystin-dependent protein
MLPKKCIFNRNKLTALIVVFGALSVSVPVQACGSDPYLGEICTFAFDYCPEGFVEADGRLLAVNANQALLSLLANRYGGDGITNFAVPDLRNRAPTGKGSSRDFPTIGTKYGALSATLTINQMPAHAHAAQFTPVTGNQTVNIPATQGNLSVNAALPVSTQVGTTTGILSVLNNGQTGYLAGLAGKVGVPAVTFTGPYTTTQPAAGSMATLPANVTVSGTASTAATSATIAAVTGGTVNVSPAGGASPSNSVPTISPSLAITYCIATQGLYPARQ